MLAQQGQELLDGMVAVTDREDSPWLLSVCNAHRLIHGNTL
jgi:hypothetical protein